MEPLENFVFSFFLESGNRKLLGNLIPQKVSQNLDIPAKKLKNQVFCQGLTQYSNVTVKNSKFWSTVMFINSIPSFKSNEESLKEN